MEPKPQPWPVALNVEALAVELSMVANPGSPRTLHAAGHVTVRSKARPRWRLAWWEGPHVWR